jgi:hypothetical protein
MHPLQRHFSPHIPTPHHDQASIAIVRVDPASKDHSFKPHSSETVAAVQFNRFLAHRCGVQISPDLGLSLPQR